MAPNLIITFVVLVCACVTINTVSTTEQLKIGTLQNACMKIRKGSTAGFAHHVGPIIMPQIEADFQLPLPKCVGKTNGVDVAACDDDRIPAVKFTDLSTVVVHTTSNLETFIVVRITLHCAWPQTQPSVGNIQTSLLLK